MARIKVLLVDNEPMVRAGLRAMLLPVKDIVVVGEAEDGQAAEAAAAATAPDVVLMDLRMPAMDGVQATRRLHARRPDLPVIILTGWKGDSYLVEAVRAGARGYLLKGASQALLTNAIRAVHSGGTLFQAGLVQAAIAGMFSPAPSPAPSAAAPAGSAAAPRLTRREMEVLRLLVEGRTNRDIGAALFVTPDAVKKHVRNICAKLEAADRTEAAVKAVRAGLL